MLCMVSTVTSLLAMSFKRPCVTYDKMHQITSPLDMFPANAEPAMRGSADVIFRDRAGVDDVAAAPTEWCQVSPLIRAAIKKIHETHSHAPYKELLARHLQQAGARRVAVDAARLRI